jgi:prepilin-type N-terminal cleavage/methylation domain-containing protein
MVNMRKRRSRRGRGFTLIEVLVALLVSSAGLLGALALMLSLLRGSMRSRQITEATMLAESGMEIQNQRPFNAALVIALPPEINLSPFGVVTPPAPQPPFTLYTRQTAWNWTFFPSRARCTVTVSWTDDSSGPLPVTRSVTVERERSQ